MQVNQLVQPRTNEDPPWLTALPSAQVGLQAGGPVKHALPSWQPAAMELSPDDTPPPASPNNTMLLYAAWGKLSLQVGASNPA